MVFGDYVPKAKPLDKAFKDAVLEMGQGRQPLLLFSPELDDLISQRRRQLELQHLRRRPTQLRCAGTPYFNLRRRNEFAFAPRFCFRKTLVRASGAGDTRL